MDQEKARKVKVVPKDDQWYITAVLLVHFLATFTTAMSNIHNNVTINKTRMLAWGRKSSAEN